MKDAEGDGGLSDKSGGGKRNHLSYTSSPGEMPNQQSKYRFTYNYRTLTLFIGTYTRDCKVIPWYLGQTLDQTLESIPGGCFCVRVTLALVSFSIVDRRNYSSF
jgi:hypothetical protein